ncbi:MAG: hypothetical protein RSB71_04410 [Bacilli bacterium]
MKIMLMIIKNILFIINFSLMFLIFSVADKHIASLILLSTFFLLLIIYFWDLVRCRQINFNIKYNVLGIVIGLVMLFIFLRVDIDCLLFYQHLDYLKEVSHLYNARSIYYDANVYYLLFFNICLILYNLVNRDTKFSIK